MSNVLYSFSTAPQAFDGNLGEKILAKLRLANVSLADVRYVLNEKISDCPVTKATVDMTGELGGQVVNLITLQTAMTQDEIQAFFQAFNMHLATVRRAKNKQLLTTVEASSPAPANSRKSSSDDLSTYRPHHRRN